MKINRKNIAINYNPQKKGNILLCHYYGIFFDSKITCRLETGDKIPFKNNKDKRNDNNSHTRILLLSILSGFFTVDQTGSQSNSTQLRCFKTMSVTRDIE